MLGREAAAPGIANTHYVRGKDLNPNSAGGGENLHAIRQHFDTSDVSKALPPSTGMEPSRCHQQTKTDNALWDIHVDCALQLHCLPSICRLVNCGDDLE